MNLFKTSTTVQAPSPISELTQPPLVRTPITGEEQPPVAALRPSPPPDLQQSPPAQIFMAEREYPDQPSLPLKSFEAYCNRLRDLEDRFFEKDEFLDSMIGKEVEWTGFVYNISSSPQSSIISLLIGLNLEKYCSASFHFSEQRMHKKLYALRKNDKVQVTRIYENHIIPILTGINVKRLDK